MRSYEVCNSSDIDTARRHTRVGLDSCYPINSCVPCSKAGPVSRGIFAFLQDVYQFGGGSYLGMIYANILLKISLTFTQVLILAIIFIIVGMILFSSFLFYAEQTMVLIHCAV